MSFYPVFEEDLRKTEECVVVFSPFIARRRMSTLMDTFHYLVDSGVKVFLITRDPSRNGHNVDDNYALIEEIRRAGIGVIIASQEVSLHNSFHEKIALIDNVVAYFGSLNILSQSEGEQGHKAKF